MKLVRTAAVVALFGAFTAGAITGQEKGSAGKAKGQLPQGWSKLNLTAEQKQKVYGIQAKYKEKIDELQRKIEEARDSQRKEELAVLTAEQKAKLRDLVTGEPEPKKK